MAKKDERLNIRISSELKKEFLEYIKKMGYSQTGLIERLIREELERRKPIELPSSGGDKRRRKEGKP